MADSGPLEHLDREPLSGTDSLSPEHHRETRPYPECA